MLFLDSARDDRSASKNPACTRLKDKYTKYLLQHIFCRKLQIEFFSPMKTFSIAVLLVLMVSCSKSDRVNNCNYLANVDVYREVNLSFPEYSQLQFTSNSALIQNEGISGVIVMNVGNDRFRAWEATDPNHAPNPSCSQLTIIGANAKCGCQDENEYSLFTGQSIGTNLGCGLKEYRVEIVGTNLLLVTD